MKSLLSTAYWPNLHYIYYVLHSETTCIEQYENYQKQSFRNRCTIITANGPLHLSIPVKHLAKKELSKDIQISYQENWQAKHWRAIMSAYKNSPYFEHFEQELSELYLFKPNLLMEFNDRALQLVLKLVRVKKHIQWSQNYVKEPSDYLDKRNITDVKYDFRADALVSEVLTKPYYQTFESKLDFTPNTSVLDLLFNTGLESLSYLTYSK